MDVVMNAYVFLLKYETQDVLVKSSLKGDKSRLDQKTISIQEN